MPSAKINPQLRTGGQLRFHKAIESIRPGQNCVAISDIGSKKFSFNVVVKNIVEEESVNDKPVLDVDKNLVGILSQGDEVELFPYNVPMAEKIVIGLAAEQHRGFVKGDWTSTLKEPLLGKTYDIGDKVKAAIDLRNRMMIMRGNLIDSYPEAPVKVVNGTQILLEKMPAKHMDNLRRVNDKKKQNRVDELHSLIKEELKQKVANAKTNLTMVSDEIEFEAADPRMIDHTVDQIFIGYEKINLDVIFTEGKYSASRSYAINLGDKIKQIIEYSITGFENHGKIVVRVYDQEEMKARKQARDLWSMISKFHEGLKEEAIGYDNECPNCGGELDLENIDEDGMARCKFCRQKSRVKEKF